MRFDAAAAAEPGAALLGRPGPHRAVVRFSRAAGLPEPLPDLLGLTLRLVDVHGEGRHQDFLLITSADGRIAHYLLLPARRGFFGQSFSSILPYRIGERVALVGAAPGSPAGPAPGGDLEQLEATAPRGDLRFELTLADLLGRWERIGSLEVGERLPDEVTEGLRFNPWNTGGGVRPTGPLMGIREAAYAGSQRGRGAA